MMFFVLITLIVILTIIGKITVNAITKPIMLVIPNLLFIFFMC